MKYRGLIERRGKKDVIKDHAFKATDSAHSEASRNNYCNFFPDRNLLKGTSFRQMAKKKKNLNVQHGHFLLVSWNTLAASKIGTSHDFSPRTDPYWECPSYTVILMNEPVPRNKLCTGGEKPLNSTFLGGGAGWERQLLGAHKKNPLPLIFSSQI